MTSSPAYRYLQLMFDDVQNEQYTSYRRHKQNSVFSLLKIPDNITNRVLNKLSLQREELLHFFF